MCEWLYCVNVCCAPHAALCGTHCPFLPKSELGTVSSVASLEVVPSTLRERELSLWAATSTEGERAVSNKDCTGCVPITPHCTTPYHTAPHHTTLHATTLHATTPHHTQHHHTAPHYMAPHHTAPNTTAPHHTAPRTVHLDCFPQPLILFGAQDNSVRGHLPQNCQGEEGNTILRAVVAKCGRNLCSNCSACTCVRVCVRAHPTACTSAH